MYRISKTQKENNLFLQKIDNYLFVDAIQVVNDKITLTGDIQKLFITENFTRFSDITTNIKDLLKLDERTVILIDSTTQEEKDITIEIEGGI